MTGEMRAMTYNGDLGVFLSLFGSKLQDSNTLASKDYQYLS